MNKLTTILLTTSLLLNSGYLAADDLTSDISVDDAHLNKIVTNNEVAATEFILDLGWDSRYISEGRNNLDKGGIYWATAVYQYDNISLYAVSGRADSEHYIEWNLGLEYGITLSENLVGAVGYQRIETYGDERCSDNELFALLEYTALDWLTPSLGYTYSTEAGGYFVEVSLHSNWTLSDSITVTPYITQAFDFKYATEAHDGPNHFQFGLEAQYQLNTQVMLSGLVSHTIAQEDIKQENSGSESNLNQTYAGVHISWSF
ncbi:hypothetical protein [Shewanella psychrotolerans]|uniref:hypothetical protein n=1 Tax=Shewanella psychrotolerans TaxID=2864206 RepID=UPI001C6591EC|nr:hypothetical protein [Shewanella psychrotolerans]QYK01268.1 hypothetical protein K0I62_18245 [Shewanella psychrotolerans]